MTLDQFVTKYDGKPIDFDGSWGDQCVDLYRQYVKEVLKLPQSKPVVGAKDIWNTYLPQYFEQIFNSPTGVPEKGDIVIWGSLYGPFGHVGVFIEGTTKSFISFDQNDPVGTKCHVQKHTYKGVLGWLRVKETIPAPQLLVVITDQTRIPQIDNLQVDQIKSKLSDTIKDFGVAIREIESLQATLSEAQEQLRLATLEKLDRENTESTTESTATNTEILIEGPFTKLGRALDQTLNLG